MTVAEAERRNRKITSTTRPSAIIKVTCTSSTDWRIDTERSNETSRLTAGGTSRPIGPRSLFLMWCGKWFGKSDIGRILDEVANILT
jgi:hypothetical protein